MEGSLSRAQRKASSRVVARGLMRLPNGAVMGVWPPSSGYLYMFGASRPIKLEVVRGSILHVIGLHDLVKRALSDSALSSASRIPA